MNAPRYFAQAVAACALAVLVAACGSSTTTTTTPPSSNTTSPASSASAVATITSNWETFFDAAKTPTATRISLLQNGSQFPAKDLAATGIASAASAQVTSVTNVTASTAVVKYNVLLSGTPALKDQTGTAVYQDGTWKVGISSFCSLLTLEKTSGFISSVPSVCRTGT